MMCCRFVYFILKVLDLYMSKKRRHFRIYIGTSLKNQVYNPLPKLKSWFYPLWSKPASQCVCVMNSQCMSMSLECFNRDVGTGAVSLLFVADAGHWERWVGTTGSPVVLCFCTGCEGAFMGS